MLRISLASSKDHDEYEIFRVTIQGLKNNHEALYDNWFKGLTQPELELYKKVVHTKRVEINSFHQSHNIDTYHNLTQNAKDNVPRSVVKIKRSQN